MKTKDYFYELANGTHYIDKKEVKEQINYWKIATILLGIVIVAMIFADISFKTMVCEKNAIVCALASKFDIEITPYTYNQISSLLNATLEDWTSGRSIFITDIKHNKTIKLEKRQ